MLCGDCVRGLPGLQSNLLGQSLSFSVTVGLGTRLGHCDFHVRNVDGARPACGPDAFVALLQELAAAEHKEKDDCNGHVDPKAGQEGHNGAEWKAGLLDNSVCDPAIDADR